MSQRRLSPQQITEILGRAEGLLKEGLSLPKAAKRLGVSYCTLYQWRKRGAVVGAADEIQRLKQLEAENLRLRRALGAFRRAARADLKLVEQ